ncbi:MAG: hypothetical protein JWP91_1086 [Fibrobacteres bacterium]|nr:hypothetical protein [Fibrobacterota bacterium]
MPPEVRHYLYRTPMTTPRPTAPVPDGDDRAPARDVPETTPPIAISLYDYADYRAYLKDWYKRERDSERKISYRSLAREIGFKSPGHFSLIVNAKANLSLKILDRFIRYLGLSKKEAEYFQALVLYNQAKAQEDKKRYFDRMLSFKQFRVRSIAATQYEFLEKWYYMAVREVLAVHSFKGDYAALAQMIVPSINTDEARKAIETLKRLGLITRDAQGRWLRVETVLAAGPEAPALAVNSFLSQAMDLAKSALDNIPKEDRVLAATTVSVSKGTFEEIREETRNFRKRILEMAQRDPKPDRIYQFQFHVFPLSKTGMAP